MMLFHIVEVETWRRLSGGADYQPSSLEAEGFIHLSTAEQLAGTIERFYSGRDDLLVLQIDAGVLTAELRFEPADGDHFPHLFGPLELDAVVAVDDIAAHRRT